jgi:predicted GIY-YIG superfamily endonuclease
MNTRVLYVLRLNQNKYYVGVTSNLENRLNQHESLNGSEWTRKHKIIGLISSEPLFSEFQEDMKVKELMSVHGIDNVRGGKYSRVYLSLEEKKLLTEEIQHAKGLCFKCGQKGHVAANCDSSCGRCGRNHSRTDCFAKTTVSGQKLCRGINKNGLHCAKKTTGKSIFCSVHREHIY